MRRLLPLLLLLVACCFTACSDDEKTVDDYAQAFAELTTDATGRATNITFDDGKSYALNNDVSGLEASKTYRILALYLIENGGVSLTNYATILTAEATRYEESKLVYDPVTVLACWQSGHYVNLRMSLKATNQGVHLFGFQLGTAVTNADGTHTLAIDLVHDQNNDPQSYARTAYLSLPLRPLVEAYASTADSVAISVKTFDGTKRYAFPLVSD